MSGYTKPAWTQVVDGTTYQVSQTWTVVATDVDPKNSNSTPVPVMMDLEVVVSWVEPSHAGTRPVIRTTRVFKHVPDMATP